MTLDEAVSAITAERARHRDLYGSEFDLRNSPNDWLAIAAHYLSQSVRRGTNAPCSDDYVQSLVKAAAVILAALEHVEVMAAGESFAA